MDKMTLIDYLKRYAVKVVDNKMKQEERPNPKKTITKKNRHVVAR